MHLLKDCVNQWREGASRSQVQVLIALVVLEALCLVTSVVWEFFPLTGFFFWLVLGMMSLRFRFLVVLAVPTAIMGTIALVTTGPLSVVRIVALVMFYLTIVFILFTSSRQLTGLPSTLSASMLIELRGRLNRQGKVPPLPHGWQCETAMVTAHSVGYAGDFMVADLDEDDHLSMVLVDVVGKGLRAAPSALMLAGAFGGMAGALRGPDLFRAANTFLLRQDAEDAFATAVAVRVSLRDGTYSIMSAGHPPALRWVESESRWAADTARGLALGVLPDPQLEESSGVLAPGEALLFYTDGVVESRGGDIEDGIAWLEETAREAWQQGFCGAAARVLAQVSTGDDDRALLILRRPKSPLA